MANAKQRTRPPQIPTEERLSATATQITEYAAQQIIDAQAEMMVAGEPGDEPEADSRDRARMILASSAFPAKMVFDSVSDKRRQAFARPVLEPHAATSRH